jgi:hypothetical protein
MNQPPSAPGNLPHSPTGRVPKWVVDEAAGIPSDPVPFRAYGAPDVLAKTPTAGRSRAKYWAGVLLGLAILAGMFMSARYLGMSPAAPNSVATDAPIAAPPEGLKTQPPPGQEEASTPLGSAPTAPAAPSDSYRFIAMQDDGITPVTWSPCRPIHYVIRVANSPKGGSDAIDRTFARAAAATGLTFVNDGVTDEAPMKQRDAYLPDRYGDRWAPVLVAWATPDEVPDFGVDIAGEAWAIRAETPSGDSAYISGIVHLDPAKFKQARNRAGAAVAESVLIHEVGHLVGLAHVNDPSQIMWPRGNSKGLTEYQAGDLAGLSQLGRGTCQPDV